jgi:predicted nucleic acid-binding protein
MINLVVDASVAIKWLPPFRQEPLVSEAQILLNRWEQGTIDLIAPDLIWIEIANVHWRAVRHNKCSSGAAQASLAILHEQEVPTVPSEPLIDLALRIALLHGRTAHDSLYVALAVTLKSELITADEKLANALTGFFPITWLGAI